MFELVFAWAIFTAVLGKSAESVMHAWKGTAPPSHLRRMARIRAREAADARRGVEPPNGFQRWARTVWADSWNAATERHAERWPTKAAKKAEYARRRWQWWDHMEEESARRWEERARARRAARQAHQGDDVSDDDTGRTGAPAAERSDTANRPRRRYMAWESPDRYGRYVAWEDLTDTERELWRIEHETDPATRLDDSGERGRLRGTRQRVRDQVTNPQNTPPEGPLGDTTGAGGTVIAFPTPNTTDTTATGGTTTKENNDMSTSNDSSEVLGLDGSIAFADGVISVSQANVTNTEQAVAAMERGDVGEGPVGRARQLMEAMDAVATIAEALKSDLERMKGVQEQYDANPDSGDKEFVTGGR